MDKHYCKRVLVTCDLVAVGTIAVVAGLLAAGQLRLPFAFVAGLVAATLQAFIDPTLNKSVSEVVSPEDVEPAVGLLSSTQSIANFAGAVAGAMLIGKLGIAGTAAMSAAGYLISSSASALARFRFRRPVEKESAGASQSAGWQLIADQPLLRKVLVGFGVINFFSVPTLVVLPIYTRRTLQGSAATLGTLEASLWLGLMLGTLSSGAVRFSSSRIRTGAACMGLMGASLAVPLLVTSVPLYMAALFVAGLSLGASNVKFLSLFQEVVRPEIKGRFFALMQAVIGFTFPIAYFFFGVLTDYLAPPTVCGLQGAGVVVLAFFFLGLARGEQDAGWIPLEIRTAQAEGVGGL